MYPESILPIATHIPHAGIEIPATVRDQFSSDSQALWREVLTVTDWYTDELFGLPGIARTQTPISRIVVDTERYIDDLMEPRAAVGQGVIYSHDSCCQPIRRELLDNYYRPWHLKLELDIEQQLARWGHCLLLDCHSFPNEAFGNQDPHPENAPDICLGVHDRNTPQWLIASCLRFLIAKGYTVSLDFPYAGCLVPDRFVGYLHVPAIMLEVNRHLYLESISNDEADWGDLPVKGDAFDRVRNHLWGLMLLLVDEAHCRDGSRIETRVTRSEAWS